MLYRLEASTELDATRKPRQRFRYSGEWLSRNADRQNLAPSPRLPPRITWSEPAVAPVGSSACAAEYRPYQSAQEAKHALSERSRTTVPLGYAGLRMRVDLTRVEFEDLTRELLERTETTTNMLIKEAGLDWPQVDRVLLVGGSTRMPMVGEMLRRVTGREPDRTVSPDEVVAHGAALYAALLREQGTNSPLSQCQLVNVNSHSLGIVGLDPATRQRVNSILIKKNTPLPCDSTRVFKTAKADQRSVKVAVVEGESHRPEDCIALGECVVRDLPPGLPKGSPIQVQYRYGTNGRITVMARVAHSRQWARVDIERNRQRDLKTLDYWRARLLGRATGEEPTAAAPGALPPVNPKDPASVVRRLDALHTLVGRAAVKLKLPPKLARAQQAAQRAAAQLAAAHDRLQHATATGEAAVSQSEKIRSRAELTRAQTDVELARKQDEFTHLVLGRDCVNAGCPVAGAEGRIAEIRELRSRLPG